MVKLDVLKENVKFISSARGYSIPIKVFLEGESIDGLMDLANNAEGKLRNRGLSLIVDFLIDERDSSIVNLSFKEEDISNLNEIIRDFKIALEISIKERKEREIKRKESEKEQEKSVKETLEKIKQIKFD